MSGADSQRGLVYQQRYLTFRALAALGLGGGSTAGGSSSIAEFSIEGRTSREGPIWDVRLAFTNQRVDLCECKDTEISKNDRLDFYDRIRGEVASGTAADDIQAVWVTDVEGGPKWQRRAGIGAVESDSAQLCILRLRQDGGVSLRPVRRPRGAQECDPIWSSGKRSGSRS